MKILKRVLLVLLAVIVLAIAAVLIIWRGEIRSVCSVHQVEDNKYLYEMHYYAPYDLDALVAADVDGNAALLAYVEKVLSKGLIRNPKVDFQAGPAGLRQGDHCTSFQVMNADSDAWIYGRNYDYSKNPALVVHTHPKNGYAALAVTDMAHIGYSLEKLPDSFKHKALCLAAVYAPIEGINEKGLCTSLNAIPNQAARQSTGKHVVGTSIIMRLWLDRCATVEEALALLDTVDVRHDAAFGQGYHYMLADAQGHCCEVEFDKNDGWKTMITTKPDTCTWMQVTNHLLAPKYFTQEPDSSVGNPGSKSWWRYEEVGNFMAAHNGRLTIPEAQECLSAVHWVNQPVAGGHVEDTQWSDVYDQSARILYMRPWNDYDHTYIFPL